MTAPLSETQTAILTAAAKHPEQRLDWFPDHLKGGARTKVLASLQTKGLIASQDDYPVLTPAGLAALGWPATPREANAAATPQPAEDPAPDAPRARKTRANTKQATVIALLQRPEGATLEQLVAATGWLKRTVRGCLAGTLKKKLGLTITSDKVAGAERVYRAT